MGVMAGPLLQSYSLFLGISEIRNAIESQKTDCSATYARTKKGVCAYDAPAHIHSKTQRYMKMER